MSDPELREAKTALEELSQDPVARRLAEERRIGAAVYRMSMAQERREGREEGRTEGLRDAVERVCQTLGVAMTEGQRQSPSAATAEQAQAILDHVAVHRKWPG